MESIVPECTPLKKDYDKCFNQWFSERFLKGDSRVSAECEKLFQEYQNCIKHKIKDINE